MSYYYIIQKVREWNSTIVILPQINCPTNSLMFPESV